MVPKRLVNSDLVNLISLRAILEKSVEVASTSSDNAMYPLKLNENRVDRKIKLSNFYRIGMILRDWSSINDFEFSFSWFKRSMLYLVILWISTYYWNPGNLESYFCFVAAVLLARSIKFYVGIAIVVLYKGA